MSQIERDGGVVDDETPETLNFQEFCQIMKNVEGESTAELVAAFAQKAQVDALMDQVNEPIWMKWKREMEEEGRDGGVKFNTAKNARMKLAEVLDGNTTQLVVMVLILLDVVAVILEIVVHELYCPCDPYYLKDSTATAKKWKGVMEPKSDNGKLGDNLDADGVGWTHPDYTSYYGRRMMEEEDFFDEPDSQRVFGLHITKLNWDDIYSLMGYASHSYDGSGHRRLAGGLCPSQLQYEYTMWLQCLSLGILCLFGFQILALFFVYGPREFCTNPFYVLDFMVVYGALLLEMPYDCSVTKYNKNPEFITFDDYGGTHFGCKNVAQSGALMTLILCWRIARIVHGVMTSVELQQEKKHEAVKEKQKDILSTLVEARRTFAKKRFTHSKYHDKLVEMGVRYLTEGEDLKKEDEAMSMEGLSEEAMKERLHEAERMYATLYAHVDVHHEHLKDTERKVKAHIDHGHGHGHSNHEHTESAEGGGEEKPGVVRSLSQKFFG